MKTRTRIGAMILVLALLCAVPVGAETETTMIDDYVAYHLENDAPDAELDIAIWLPQADWGTGEGIPKYVGHIVTVDRVLSLPNEDRIYAFLCQEHDPDTLETISDYAWFIKQHRVLSDKELYISRQWLTVTLTVAEIRELIAEEPIAFISYGIFSWVERLPWHHEGDANEDEVVDSRDARLTLQYAVGKVTHPRFIHLYEADINGDNTVDSADARQILQKAVGTF